MTQTKNTPEKKKRPGSGRKPGSGNVITTDMRKLLAAQLTKHINHLDETISAIEDPAQKAQAIAHYLQYIIPKYSSTTINTDTTRSLTTEQHLMQLDAKYKKREITLKQSQITIVDND